MDVPFKRMLTEKPFVFCVGTDGQEFHVHRDAIGKLSPALQSLITNEAFKEAREGRTFWDDVEVDTFARFCEFAYTGSYTDPVEGDLEPPEGIEVDLAVEESMVWEDLAPCNRRHGQSYGYMGPCCNAYICQECGYADWVVDWGTDDDEMGIDRIDESDCPDCGLVSTRKELWTEDNCMEAKFLSIKNAVGSDKIFSSLGVTLPKEDGPSSTICTITNLLAHAKLYVLGDKWDILTLRALSLRKVQRALIKADLNESNIGALIELVRFTYENTAIDKDGMRGLLTHYAVANIKMNDLGSRKGFLDLLDEVQGFARDLWKASYELRML